MPGHVVDHLEGGSHLPGQLAQGLDGQIATSWSRKACPPRRPLVRYDGPAVAQEDSGRCGLRVFPRSRRERFFNSSRVSVAWMTAVLLIPLVLSVM